MSLRRGEIYRLPAIQPDTRPRRAYVIVSRNRLIESDHSTVICAPVYTSYAGLATQVPIGESEGLKHGSSIHCDALVSIQKSLLTNFIGSLSAAKTLELNRALAAALGLPNAFA